MLNSTILLKVRLRLNKLASNDYDNIMDWQIVEAFNKGQVDWCRRNLHGTNIKQEGDEQSTSRVDDLQVLLSSYDMIVNDRKTYYESVDLPFDYLRWKRVSTDAKSECCPARPMVVYLAEQANLNELLRDHNKKPNFEWGETFATFKGNKIQLYTNGEFEIVDPQLVYYRQPVRIQMAGVKDPYSGITPANDVESEFKDDLIELFVDECAKIIAGDIESQLQMQRQAKSVEDNN
tara:strand:- start:3348 stop:4049 length:702 start_codon:yes stop_codon:yes gene_type:complete